MHGRLLMELREKLTKAQSKTSTPETATPAPEGGTSVS